MGYEFEHLIQEYKRLPIREVPKTTFLEIVNKSHFENVWSRILAFYFDPKAGHNLGNMLVKSLFDSLGKHPVLHNINTYRVHTEYPTKKGNRIDIVIESNDFVIGIENKVNSPLYNDLEDYSDAIESLAKGKESYKIVLSKYKNITHSGFENLIYEKFLGSIKNNIGYHYNIANPKYVIFLFDFIDNIEKNLNLINMIHDPEKMNFFLKEKTEIQKLINDHTQINKELYRTLLELCSKLQNNVELQKHFRQMFQNENFILKVCNITRDVGGLDCLWILIEQKDQYPEIVCCTIYYENYKWFAECGAKEKYSKIFEGCFDDDPKFWFELDPWTTLEDINSKVIDILHNLFELVKHQENEIF